MQVTDESSFLLFILFITLLSDLFGAFLILYFPNTLLIALPNADRMIHGTIFEVKDGKNLKIMPTMSSGYLAAKCCPKMNARILWFQMKMIPNLLTIFSFDCLLKPSSSIMVGQASEMMSASYICMNRMHMRAKQALIICFSTADTPFVRHRRLIMIAPVTKLLSIVMNTTKAKSENIQLIWQKRGHIAEARQSSLWRSTTVQKYEQFVILASHEYKRQRPYRAMVLQWFKVKLKRKQQAKRLRG